MIAILCLFIINIGGLIFLTFYGDEQNIPSRTEREFEMLEKKNLKTKD